MSVARVRHGFALPRDAGRVLLPVVVLVVWQVLYKAIGEPAFASPLETLVALFGHLSSWLPDIGITLLALMIAFIISAIVGILLGFAIGLSAYWSEVLVPLLVAGYAIPKIVFYPVFLLVFGVTLQGRIAFSVLHGVLPIAILVAGATRTVPAVYLKVGRSYNLSFLQRARHILIPAVVPATVAALRMGFGLCFLGLILAEMFASYDGIGFRLINLMTLNQTDRIFAAVLIVVFVAFFVTFAFFLWQERRELRIGKAATDIL
jgi:NitT/TauT family transport system permease protein